MTNENQKYYAIVDSIPESFGERQAKMIIEDLKQGKIVGVDESLFMEVRSHLNSAEIRVTIVDRNAYYQMEETNGQP